MNVRTFGWQVFARLDGRVLGWCESLRDAMRAIADARAAGVLADVKRVLVVQAHL